LGEVYYDAFNVVLYVDFSGFEDEMSLFYFCCFLLEDPTE